MGPVNRQRVGPKQRSGIIEELNDFGDAMRHRMRRSPREVATTRYYVNSFAAIA
jgi:hypothetical protein